MPCTKIRSRTNKHGSQQNKAFLCMGQGSTCRALKTSLHFTLRCPNPPQARRRRKALSAARLVALLAKDGCCVFGTHMRLRNPPPLAACSCSTRRTNHMLRRQSSSAEMTARYVTRFTGTSRSDATGRSDKTHTRRRAMSMMEARMYVRGRKLRCTADVGVSDLGDINADNPIPQSTLMSHVAEYTVATAERMMTAVPWP